jgi:hypothetical protein
MLASEPARVALAVIGAPNGTRFDREAASDSVSY